ncbi:MAG TPA: TetR family transcriptional regulator [Acidimicrobiales bacterium]
MAKAGRRSTTKGRFDAASTRQKLVEAAFQILSQDGFTHASARTIATRAGSNPALVFYYFDSVNDLLVAALAHSSRTQRDRYQRALADVTSLLELVTAVESELREDFDTGHVKVLAELVAASAHDEELRDAVLAEVDPWLRFTEDAVDRVLRANGLEGAIPSSQVAFLLVSLFLGMEQLGSLVSYEREASLFADLFGSARNLAGLVTGWTTTPTRPPPPSVLGDGDGAW